jgi:predicted regulator of Ras-like GTPase activity (Roadblock/LC7/MglB family)
MATELTMNLKDILNDLTHKGAIVAAIAVSRDGFVIDAAKSEEVDLDAIGALVSSAMLAWEGVATEIQASGPPDVLLAEFPAGPIAVTQVNKDSMLVLMGSRFCNLGRIRVETQRVRAMVAECL